MEALKDKSKSLYGQLSVPELKYGLGIVASLKDFDIDNVFSESCVSSLEVDAPSGVEVKKLSECDLAFQELYAEGLVNHDENKFTALFYSLLDDAVVIRVPKNVKLDKPVYVKSFASNKVQAEKIIVVAEPYSKVKIVEESGSKDSYYKGQVVEVYAQEGAEVYYYNVQDCDVDTYNFTLHRGKVEASAQLHWLCLNFGGKFSQLNMRTELLSPGACSTKRGVFFANGDQEFDFDDVTVHRAKRTKSMMRNRGIVDGKARTIYRGNVKIVKDASNCVGHQKAETLLLSDEAKASAVPILEVDNDEVVCSHGATFSKLKDEQMFYLNSRGMDEGQARDMIVKGFVTPLIDDLPGEELQARVMDLVERKNE